MPSVTKPKLNVNILLIVLVLSYQTNIIYVNATTTSTTNLVSTHNFCKYIHTYNFVKKNTASSNYPLIYGSKYRMKCF